MEPRGWLTRLHLDGWLLLGIVLLIGTSLLVVYSASGGNMAVVERHGLRIALAFGAMLVMAQVPPKQLMHWAPWLFIAGLVMLVAVLFTGTIGKGARRWLDFGFARFQPSELMKLALPMFLAWLYAWSPLPPSWPRLLAGLGAIAITAGLIVVEPDLGTSLLIAASGLFVLFFAGLSWKFILGALGTVIAALPVIWHFMYDYQKQRVLTFLNPESDPLGAGYHIIQSKIAIGSGGVWGKGFMGSTQAHLEFLPESTTDFIFSVFSEEFGLWGVALLLLGYTFVIFRGLHIAWHAEDNFGRLLAASLSMTLFIYAFVNIGMVSGLLPVVGLPLPLISYGGSALITLMLGFGMLMSIQTHKSRLRPEATS